ncbi:MAG: M20/M25/M40 family metallo-hydrolase [Saprospiraceae bacterium]|nr:M20/M25/M40 family metallo-hydrolase [Saprospiraceae bacterium]
MKRSEDAISLLKSLISSPSTSGEEEGTANLIEEFLHTHGIKTFRRGHNVLAFSGGGSSRPTVLLCSHHDTVRPNKGYTRDPYQAEVLDGKLYGLGSNDAGGALVSLIAAYIVLSEENLPFQLALACVAEEETSGPNGVTSILEELPPIDLAIVGEPTKMQMATAEKGLLVIDGSTNGVPGHSAHEGTINPIYLASSDVLAIQNHEFAKTSPLLGPTRASVTVIQAGTQHNQVPAQCTYVIDVRINEQYSNEEVFDKLQQLVEGDLRPRSFRLKSSGLPEDHPILNTARKLDIPTFGSGTLSDQALLPYPSIKIGPGDTLRSHTADEFIYLHEIEQGIDRYIEILRNYEPL